MNADHEQHEKSVESSSSNNPAKDESEVRTDNSTVLVISDEQTGTSDTAEKTDLETDVTEDTVDSAKVLNCDSRENKTSNNSEVVSVEEKVEKDNSEIKQIETLQETKQIDVKSSNVTEDVKIENKKDAKNESKKDAKNENKKDAKNENEKDAKNETNVDAKNKNNEGAKKENNEHVKNEKNKDTKNEKNKDTKNEKNEDAKNKNNENGKNENNEDEKEASSKSVLKKKRKTSDVHDDSTSLEETRRKRQKIQSTNDRFCWRCHKEYVDAFCSACPRSWHRKCIGGIPPDTFENWICGECVTILQAENAETRSTTTAHLSIDQLCMLLKYVIERMRDYPGSEPFWKAVDLNEVPNYLDYVVKPMDLSLLEFNVLIKLYGSTDAFMADAKWIQHNCIVFNTCGGVYTDTSKLTNSAKQMIKVARQEVSEIEACPDCYMHGRNLPKPQPLWFIEPCRKPHPLVWAKLKGFPFWPAKAMPRINSQGFVDVRFFGEHDRAWVSPKDMFLYSEDPPTPLPRKRKLDMDACVREITLHCRKLELMFGEFRFAPPRVQYNPNDPAQIKVLLPNYDPLHPKNAVTVQFLGTKKKALAKQRVSSVKKVNQSDTSAVINSDTDSNSTCNTSDINMNVGEKNTETTPKLQTGSTAESNKTSKLGATPDQSRIDLNVTQETEEDAKQQSTAKQKPPKDKTDKVAKKAANTANIIILEDSNAKTTSEKSKSPENLFRPEKLELHESLKLIPISKRSILKDNSGKSEDGSHNITKSGSKSTKDITKVYKPKTRMVDKVNAEKALKSVVPNGNESNSDDTLNKIKLVSSDTVESLNNSKRPDIDATSSLSISSAKTQNKTDSHNVFTVPTTNSTTDHSVALFFFVNNPPNETPKSASDTPTTNVSSTAKQDVKNVQVQVRKKDIKAKKTLPNKSPSQPQVVTQPSSNTKLPNSTDSTTTTSNTQNDDNYQLVPPEAGPLSARLYHDTQELAKRLAQLMEEAYKEAAKPDDETNADNHQATVHFLRLQIERMKWKHQQQLSELKHNADRVLREMRASLEAEKLRAVEKARKDAEEEKNRCIEEIKRKQWCAVCGREAVFYCCWNTSYCDYPCQQSHWPIHMRTCAQQPSISPAVTNSAAKVNQQQVMPTLVVKTPAPPNTGRT